MKTSKYFLIAIAFIALVGCKDDKTDEGIVEEETMELVPNESDINFAQALKFMEKQQHSEAAKSIREGISELNKEAKDVTGKARENMEASTTQLDKIASELESGNEVQINKVRKLMSISELNVHHSYLGADDVFFLDESQTISTDAPHKKLSATISDLKKEEGKVKGDAKKEYDALMVEGKKLEDDFQSWNTKTVEYAKKVIEHKQKQVPEE